MAKHTINKQQLILEFISVVFAVLLALFLNAWRQSLKTDQLVDKVKATIREEVIKNDTLIRQSYAYRLQLLAALDSNTHVIDKIPVEALGIDVNNDRALEKIFREVTLFEGDRYLERVQIKSNPDKRVIILGDRIFNLKTENDTLYLMGLGNIILRSAEISNQGWNIAQATDAIVEMDLELVEGLSRLNTLQDGYLNTAGKAIQMIYLGDPGIRSVLQDLRNFEHDIIKADSVVLSLLD